MAAEMNKNTLYLVTGGAGFLGGTGPCAANWSIRGTE